MLIILTAGEADQVRGLTIKGHALAPVPLLDGTFVLPPECGVDPAHSKHAALLKSLPTRNVDATEYVTSKLGDRLSGKQSTITKAEQDLLEACSYKSDWQVDAAVAIGAAVLQAAASEMAMETNP